jgi:hypothetical protein
VINLRSAASGNDLESLEIKRFAKPEDDVSSEISVVTEKSPVSGFPSNEKIKKSPEKNEPPGTNILSDSLEVHAEILREFSEGEKSPVFQKVNLETPETDPVNLRELKKPIEPTYSRDAQPAIEQKGGIEAKPRAIVSTFQSET